MSSSFEGIQSNRLKRILDIEEENYPGVIISVILGAKVRSSDKDSRYPSSWKTSNNPDDSQDTKSMIPRTVRRPSRWRTTLE